MTDLAALFNLNPLNYAKDGSDTRKVVEAFRGMRHQFVAGNMKAGNTKKKKEEGPKLDLKGIML